MKKKRERGESVPLLRRGSGSTDVNESMGDLIDALEHPTKSDSDMDSKILILYSSKYGFWNCFF